MLRRWFVIAHGTYSPPALFGPYWTKKGAERVAKKAQKRWITFKVYVEMAWRF